MWLVRFLSISSSRNSEEPRELSQLVRPDGHAHRRCHGQIAEWAV